MPRTPKKEQSKKPNPFAKKEAPKAKKDSKGKKPNPFKK